MGHFCISGAFSNSQGSKASPHPTKMLDACIQNFFQVLTLYRVGGERENCKKISKRMYCFKREPRNDRKI